MSPPNKKLGTIHLYRAILLLLLPLHYGKDILKPKQVCLVAFLHGTAWKICSNRSTFNSHPLSRMLLCQNFIFIRTSSAYVLFTFLFAVFLCWIQWIVWRGFTKTTPSGWMQWSSPRRMISKSISGGSELWLHRSLFNIILPLLSILLFNNQRNIHIASNCLLLGVWAARFNERSCKNRMDKS